MGMFSGIGEAEVGQSGIYFEPGLYVVEVLKVLAKMSRKGAMLYIIECEVLESSNAERPPGCKPAQVISMAHDAAFRNIKEFIAACNGISPTRERERANQSVGEDEANYSVDESNPLGGTKLRLTCTQIETRAGNPFTLHQWEPYEGASYHAAATQQPPPVREVQWHAQQQRAAPQPQQPPPQQQQALPMQQPAQPPAQQYPAQAPAQPPPQQYQYTTPQQPQGQPPAQPPAQPYTGPGTPYDGVPF